MWESKRVFTGEIEPVEIPNNEYDWSLEFCVIKIQNFYRIFKGTLHRSIRGIMLILLRYERENSVSKIQKLHKEFR